MLSFLFALLQTLIGVLLGGYILFLGRMKLWATSGVIGFAVATNMLAILVAGGDDGWDLIDMHAWGLIAIAVAIGLAGAALGNVRPELAGVLIGIAAGANVALWFYDIAEHLMTSVASLPEETVIMVGLLLIVIGGLFGYWLIRSYRDEALILITVVLGAELINDALDLSAARSLTAILILGLSLAGILVQYGDYERKRRAALGLTEPEPMPSSVAFFQNLELD